MYLGRDFFIRIYLFTSDLVVFPILRHLCSEIHPRVFNSLTVIQVYFLSFELKFKLVWTDTGGNLT